MGGAVHALIGAAIGSLMKNKAGAFAAGVVSHAVADVLPHRDCSPAVEAPLMAAAVAMIAKWRGIDSPEFWGALGAIAPDAEHALLISGLIDADHEIFPTHIHDGKYHGPDSGERLSQVLIAAAACVVVMKRSGQPVSDEKAISVDKLLHDIDKNEKCVGPAEQNQLSLTER
ncbi:MAG: hypothetical protein ABFD49_06570 [Armatimonadota bacterium]|nr:hypothetical protein [bacterium]